MTIKSFHTKKELEVSLVEDLVKCINQSIDKHGEARLLLSGGNTPKELYKLLSTNNIHWNKVTIGLVDERFVPVNDIHSNEKMLRDILLQHAAKEIKLIGMVDMPENYLANEQKVNLLYQSFLERTDIVLLGMGNDGHVASLFPEDNSSQRILNGSEIGLFNTRSPNAPHERISCSKAMLLEATNKFLMITGKEKLALLEKSRENLLPIDYFTKEIDNLVTYYSEHEQ